jgi:hypothetical protein
MNRITSYLAEFSDDDNFDPSLPLQWNQHRHYDPTPGMWLNEDPVGYAGDDENVRKYIGPPATNPTSVDTAPPNGP